MSKQGLSARLFAPNQTLIMVKAELPKQILAEAKRRQVRPLGGGSANGTQDQAKTKPPRLRFANEAALEPSDGWGRYAWA